MVIIADKDGKIVYDKLSAEEIMTMILKPGDGGAIGKRKDR